MRGVPQWAPGRGILQHGAAGLDARSWQVPFLLPAVRERILGIKIWMLWGPCNSTPQPVSEDGQAQGVCVLRCILQIGSWVYRADFSSGARIEVRCVRAEVICRR